VRAAPLATLAVLLAATAEPCSICRCGDATFNALGKEGYATRGFRLALDWERYDKQEGPPEDASETLVENRFTALVSYGFSDSLVLHARVPLSFRDFTATEHGVEVDAFNTSGLADPELYAQLRLWASPLAPLGRRTSLSLLGGVKTSLGNNDYTKGGERVDEHAQPGTGAVEPFGALALLHLVDRRSAVFASAQYRHPGTNDFGYQYGASWLANLAYEHKLGARVDGVVELNFRDAAHDVAEDGQLPNTGGIVLYLTPRLLFDLGKGVVLRAAAQVPIVKDLNGVQEERAVVNAGITFLLGR